MGKAAAKTEPVKIDAKEIIKRGFVTQEEYETLYDRGLEKLNLAVGDGSNEGVWVHALEPSDKDGEKFRFVFFNDPIIFLGGPRPVAGLVGVATSNGKEMRAVAQPDECMKLFKKCQTHAVAYFNSVVEKDKKP
jgi:hypothetical protein